MIYLGDKKAGSICLGDKKLSKIYLGDKLVWEGYPEGHIIGTIANSSTLDPSTFANNDLIFTVVSSDKQSTSQGNVKCTLLKNSKGEYKRELHTLNYYFDADLSKVNGTIENILWSNLSSTRLLPENIISMKVTLANTIADNDLNNFCNRCDFDYINVNGVKLNYANSVSLVNSFSECSKLTELKAGNFPWNKFTKFENVFYQLPNLLLLDLSGANFDNININDDGNNFRGFQIGAKIIMNGCSPTTIINITRNVRNHNAYTERWKLIGSVFTRTA